MNDATLADFYRIDAAKLVQGAKEIGKLNKIARAEKLTPALRGYAVDALIAIAKNLLNTPLSDVLGDGWRKWRDLSAYADANAYPPTQVNEYALDEHDIALSRKPKAEIQLNGSSIGLDVPFELKIGLKLRSAILRIKGGRIVGAHVGAVHGFGEFSCADITLAERKSSKVELPGDLMFNPGYAIRG